MMKRRAFVQSVVTSAAAAAGLEPAAAAAAAHPKKSAAGVLAGKVHFKGDARYEALRQAATWNAKKPPRFPSAIVLAQNEADVVAAVKLARERGWQVTTRSGGHSWTGTHTQNNALQVNMAQMQQIDVQVDRGVVAVTPSTYGNVLNKKLRDEHGLYTPCAHGLNVGMGGFVMAGGFGWHSRVLGLGCQNLVGLDVVTAEGQLIHADEKQNSDYYWAARGAGSGFFGVATKYYMQLHPKPRIMREAGYVYDIADMETVVGWMRDSIPRFPLMLEVFLIGQKRTVMLGATALGDTEEEVEAALAVLDSCPAAARALKKWKTDTVVPYDTEPPVNFEPTGARYAVDNIWTNAPSNELVPLMKDLFSGLPTDQSYIIMLVWGQPRPLQDMAFSVQADLFIASYAVYYDPAQDERCQAWSVQAMEGLHSIYAGAQLNDENEAHLSNPAPRYLSKAAYSRLQQLHRKHDPSGVFAGFPKQAAA